jgi:hypothetical protein
VSSALKRERLGVRRGRPCSGSRGATECSGCSSRNVEKASGRAAEAERRAERSKKKMDNGGEGDEGCPAEV